MAENLGEVNVNIRPDEREFRKVHQRSAQTFGQRLSQTLSEQAGRMLPGRLGGIAQSLTGGAVAGRMARGVTGGTGGTGGAAAGVAGRAAVGGAAAGAVGAAAAFPPAAIVGAALLAVAAAGTMVVRTLKKWGRQLDETSRKLMLFDSRIFAATAQAGVAQFQRNQVQAQMQGGLLAERIRLNEMIATNTAKMRMDIAFMKNFMTNQILRDIESITRLFVNIHDFLTTGVLGILEGMASGLEAFTGMDVFGRTADLFAEAERSRRRQIDELKAIRQAIEKGDTETANEWFLRPALDFAGDSVTTKALGFGS